MRNIVFAFIFFFFSTNIWAQATFKAGWDTYKTGMITHEYTYTYTPNDSFRLYLADSSIILSAPDSAAVVYIDYPIQGKTYSKTINYFNAKKQVIKTEDYRGDNLVMTHEWKYDDKNRKTYYYEDDKINSKNYRKGYEYATDKKNGDLVITESSYSNGRIEFYTKMYYDKNLVKYKEVRLNDNNKDVIHIESYTYNDDGRLIERSVFFPEFKVTKKFAEPGADDPPKCMKSLPLNASEKIYLPGKVIYLKNFLNKINVLLSNPACIEFEYKYSNFINDIVISTTKTRSNKVIFRYRERP